MKSILKMVYKKYTVLGVFGWDFGENALVKGFMGRSNYGGQKLYKKYTIVLYRKYTVCFSCVLVRSVVRGCGYNSGH